MDFFNGVERIRLKNLVVLTFWDLKDPIGKKDKGLNQKFNLN